MKHTVRSIGHAWSGLVHAAWSEKNFRRFLGLQVVVVLLGIMSDLQLPGWIIVLSAGMAFATVELLNTAIERLADTIDDCAKKSSGGHYHPGIRMTKDVAAAASLIALILYATVLGLLGVSIVVSHFNPL